MRKQQWLHLFLSLFVILTACQLASAVTSTPVGENTSPSQTQPDSPLPQLTTSPSGPTAVSARVMRSYALDARKLLALIDLSQSQQLSPGNTSSGRIDKTNLAIPYTYNAQPGDILLVELLLPDLAETEMQRIRPAIFIADAGGDEIGYMRGGPEFGGSGQWQSIARAGFIASAGGTYTILATLDGHYDPQQNPAYEADYALTVTNVPLLEMNRIHEETRPSTERRLYAVQTSRGEFDIVYAEVSGEPPAPYQIDVYRLGSPADGIALASTMTASYPFNFTISFLDNAYASIAEEMGLEELTYILSIDSSVPFGQEQAPYTSHFRLTIQQEASPGTPGGTATPAALLPPNPDEETWETRLNHPLRVQFKLPVTWELASETSTYYSNGDAFLELIPENHPYSDAADACQKMTQGLVAAAFGIGTGEVVRVNGLDVCVLSHPESGEPYRAIIKYPQPRENIGSIGYPGTWNFLRLDIKPAGYFWSIVEGLSIPDEPSARLFVSGVLDILRSNYYFRDEIDWDALEDGLDVRLDESSTREDAYDALRWLMEEMAAKVDHHHMVLRTPQAVQDALLGQGQQVGVLMSEDVVSLVFPNSPASVAGLQMGDRILRVNGAPFAEANFNVDRFDIVLERDGQLIEATFSPQAVSFLLPPRGQRMREVSYLETFGIFGAELPLLQAYAMDVQDAIKALDATPACGWILDVRRNTGGSAHAVLAGIAPLVGNGELYHTRRLNGPEEAVLYEDGRIFGEPVGSDWPPMVRSPYTLQVPNPPMAVLVSTGTASGGEVSAIVVSGRSEAQTRIFGEPTPGLTTPVWHLELYDGGLFYAPGQLIVDLEGDTYLEGILPDEPMPVVYDARYGTREDPLVRAALAWLKAEHGCSP